MPTPFPPVELHAIAFEFCVLLVVASTASVLVVACLSAVIGTRFLH